MIYVYKSTSPNAVIKPVCLPSQTIGLHVALLASVGDAPQLPFSRKLLVQHFQLIDELLADRCKDVARRDCAVCLYTDEQLRDVGVADYDR